MAHYAQLDSENIVVNVFVGKDEDDLVDGVEDWELYYAPEEYTVKRTSYNTFGGIHYSVSEDGNRVPSEDQAKALRKNYAGIGYSYDPERDAFIPPQPYESWILNENTCLWEAPIPLPSDENLYVWDENTLSWIAVEPG